MAIHFHRLRTQDHELHFVLVKQGRELRQIIGNENFNYSKHNARLCGIIQRQNVNREKKKKNGSRTESRKKKLKLDVI